MKPLRNVDCTRLNAAIVSVSMALMLCTLAVVVTNAQDIPLFSQKLTNSFIYNPAIAGVEFGSLTFSHRNNYSGVNGAPNSNFLSVHTPFSNYRFGVGANVFQEEVSGLKVTYMSAAFAYHISLADASTLSFGVSGEYNSVRLTDEASTQNDGTDLILARYSSGVNTPDFSFGMHYQSRFVKIGLAANRLKTAWFETNSDVSLANYYSGFVQGIIPLDGIRSTLEPFFAYRKFSESDKGYHIGLYYTYNKRIIAGLATRSGDIFSATLGFNVTKNLLLGYSRETIMGSVGGYMGASNEFVVRLDFANRSKKKHFREDYKDAISYRKKSISGAGPGSRSPHELHKAQKHLAPYSPNKRYQDTKKLSGGRKTKPVSNKRKAGGKAFRNSKYNPGYRNRG